jgi:hypothetical protein
MATSYPVTLKDVSSDPGSVAEQLAGATLGEVENAVKTKQHRNEPLLSEDEERAG